MLFLYRYNVCFIKWFILQSSFFSQLAFMNFEYKSDLDFFNFQFISVIYFLCELSIPIILFKTVGGNAELSILKTDICLIITVLQKSELRKPCISLSHIFKLYILIKYGMLVIITVTSLLK